ncbi:hypothetical protein FQN54_000910 [Arachnomyces sp. PD_36]|nr:hypothetical protein FQN54_000910 [Arachnomyces sp. PD_36]
MLQTEAENHRFIESQSPATIAARLREDQQRCQKLQLPSLLALYLPASGSSALADDISQYLAPQKGLAKAVRQLQYEAVVKGIRGYLDQWETITQTPEDALPTKHTTIPTTQEFQAALKVLDYLEKHEAVTNISSSSPLSDGRVAIQAQLGMDPDLRATYHSISKEAARGTKRRCYICRFKMPAEDAHPLYSSLCRPCGTFNLSSSELSLPSNLDLRGKVALVTGGRINLGFYTALRLLRCGAHVIVSSRYPFDTEMRYSQQHDYEGWESRLRIVGADFRTSKDAFMLVKTVKNLLEEWAPNSDMAGSLHILINNAAQTLTDPVKSEVKAIVHEEQLRNGQNSGRLLAKSGSGYEPKVRGGLHTAWIPRIEDETRVQEGIDETDGHRGNEMVQKGLGGDDEGTLGKSSWAQKLDEIPYEDLISAHSVNAFVPLILCRELLPSMGAIDDSVSHPLGYIINVSSREGILENQMDSQSKAGHHVHTNMSKAAINMITETESSKAWKRHVAMNSVDPGYMSAAPECQKDDGCPIGFEDGAARVLWPIAIGEQEGTVIRGRFLKHFGEVGATIRRG